MAASSAEALFRKGARAERQGRHVEAYLLYNRARALDPGNVEYVRAANGVRKDAARLLAASGEHRTALEIAPESWESESDPAEGSGASAVFEGLVPRQPVRLEFLGHAADFRFRGTVREAYQAIAEEFGLRAVFDGDFDGSERIRADLEGCDFRCAVRALGDLAKAIVVPVDGGRFLVAADSEAKRSELEAVAFATIPLDSGLTPDELAEVAQAIQQVVDIQRFQSTVSANRLFLRDSVSKINMAQVLAADLLHPRGEVEVELRMVSVSRNQTARAGTQLPDTFPITNFGTFLGAMPDTAGAERLVGIGGGATALGVALGDATVLASLEAGSSQSFEAARVRTSHGLPASFHAGERYPIETARYTVSDFNRGGSLVPPAPVITFEELGLKMEVTPLIHSATSVTLQLDVNVRALGGRVSNGLPVIASRQFQSQVRLRRGEFAIVTGLTVYQRRPSRRGLFGLASIPWLGDILSANRRSWNRSDLLVLVRPRIVRLPPGEVARAPTFLFGPEQRPVPAL